MITTKKYANSIPYFECVSHQGQSTQVYLLLHGFEQSKAMDFGQLPKRLTDLGYVVIIPDLDFHGERKKEPFLTGSFDQKVWMMFSLFQSAPIELNDWMEREYGHFPDWTVGGFSMGAILALKLASMNPRFRSVHAMNGTPKLENLLSKSHRDWVMKHWTKEQLQVYHTFFEEPYIPPYLPHYASIHYLIQLGQEDEYVNLDDNLAFIQTLQEHHHPHIRFHLYPSTKHEITQAMEEDAIHYFSTRKRTL